jgi:biopolymer transport protein ExbB/TolQ
VLLALWRLIVLYRESLVIRRQLLNLDDIRDDNAVGRIIWAAREEGNLDVETLELRLGEAVLAEVPRINRHLPLLKIIAAVAPLMGLLGTVTGMIVTFQAITLFGAGDPRLMAGGISQALITTVLGLCVAIPMLLLHNLVQGRARGITEPCSSAPSRWWPSAPRTASRTTVRRWHRRRSDDGADRPLLPLARRPAGARRSDPRGDPADRLRDVVAAVRAPVLLLRELPARTRRRQGALAGRPDHRSWFAEQYRNELTAAHRAATHQHFSLIGTLIKVCPLLGLLGTVIGMLEVFDALAATGSNNPRSMAAGVSKATVSTLAGMVVAIVGLLAETLSERHALAARESLPAHFPTDGEEPPCVTFCQLIPGPTRAASISRRCSTWCSSC